MYFSCKNQSTTHSWGRLGLTPQIPETLAQAYNNLNRNTFYSTHTHMDCEEATIKKCGVLREHPCTLETFTKPKFGALEDMSPTGCPVKIVHLCRYPG